MSSEIPLATAPVPKARAKRATTFKVGDHVRLPIGGRFRTDADVRRPNFVTGVVVEVTPSRPKKFAKVVRDAKGNVLYCSTDTPEMILVKTDKRGKLIHRTTEGATKIRAAS